MLPVGEPGAGLEFRIRTGDDESSYPTCLSQSPAPGEQDFVKVVILLHLSLFSPNVENLHLSLLGHRLIQT